MASGLAFALAAFIALAVVLARKLRRYFAERAFLATPGLCPESPLRVHSYTEIDGVARLTRCPCGRRLHRYSEGSQGKLRTVDLECLGCERRHRLYFDVSEVPN